MIKTSLILLSSLFAWFTAAAEQPLYIVNGEERSEIASIPPADIEHTELLPADEETIARYGQQASHGVMLITLRYDMPAIFPEGESFNDYIASQIDWPDDEPAARVVLRYRITTKGAVIVDKQLESTDSRFRRRVMNAFEEAPRWQPAQKNGNPIETEGVLYVQLPADKPMPRQVELIWR